MLNYIIMKLFLYLWVFISLVMYPSVSDAVLKDHETWMGTYLNGKKLGFSYARLKIDPRKILVNVKVYFRMMSEGVDQSTTFTQEIELNSNLKLKKFTLVQELTGHRQIVKAEVDNSKIIEVCTADSVEDNYRVIPGDSQDV